MSGGALIAGLGLYLFAAAGVWTITSLSTWPPTTDPARRRALLLGAAIFAALGAVITLIYDVAVLATSLTVLKGLSAAGVLVWYVLAAALFVVGVVRLVRQAKVRRVLARMEQQHGAVTKP